MRAHVILVGLGNPILGDDGVGWRVADEVEQQLHESDAVTVLRFAVGGLELMELLEGYDGAVLVDAVSTGGAPAGTVRSCALEDWPDPSVGHWTSAHDTSLGTALATGRRLGVTLPRAVTTVTIETTPTFTFSEELSPPVAAAVSAAAARAIEALTELEVRSHGVA